MCVFFGVVIYWSAQLREFGLSYDRTVFLLGEWLCCFLLVDLGCLPGHIWDCVLLSQGDWSLLLEFVWCDLHFFVEGSVVVQAFTVTAFPSIG